MEWDYKVVIFTGIFAVEFKFQIHCGKNYKYLHIFENFLLSIIFQYLEHAEGTKIIDWNGHF